LTAPACLPAAGTQVRHILELRGGAQRWSTGPRTGTLGWRAYGSLHGAPAGVCDARQVDWRDVEARPLARGIRPQSIPGMRGAGTDGARTGAVESRPARRVSAERSLAASVPTVVFRLDTPSEGRSLPVRLLSSSDRATCAGCSDT
jgi:hypothetical protein